MGLETFGFIDSLNASNPVGASDPKSQGDDHIRGIKSTLLATFPSVAGAITLTHTQLNNAAIKTEANVFTAAQQITNATPVFKFYESDAGADEKLWRIVTSANGFYVQTRTDADGGGATAMWLARSGTTVTQIQLNATEVELNATTIDINGAVDVSSTLDVAGQGTFTSNGSVASDAPTLQLNCAQPILECYETDAAANEKRWGLRFANGVLQWELYNDTGSGATASFLRVLRTAANIDEIELNGDLVDINGDVDIDGAVGINDILTVSRASPQMRFYETDALTDEKYWLFLNTDGILTLRAYDDSVSTNNSALRILRTGIVIDEVEINCTDLDINADVDINGDLELTTNGAFIYGYTSTASQRSLIGLYTDNDIYVGDVSIGDLKLRSGTSIQLNTTTFNTGDAVLSTDNSAANEPGYKGMPFNEQDGNYTLVLADAGKVIHKDAGGAGETITIPANSSVAFPVGTVVTIINEGGGDLSIAITTDTLVQAGTADTGTRTLADDGIATLVKVASTRWMVSGAGLS